MLRGVAKDDDNDDDDGDPGCQINNPKAPHTAQLEIQSGLTVGSIRHTAGAAGLTC